MDNFANQWAVAEQYPGQRDAVITAQFWEQDDAKDFALRAQRRRAFATVTVLALGSAA